MLFSRDQLKALAIHHRTSFERKMLDHVRSFFVPSEVDEETVRETIRDGLLRCARYGIETEYDAARFIDLMYVLGQSFDAEPPWSDILRQPVQARMRVDELCKRALAMGKRPRTKETP